MEIPVYGLPYSYNVATAAAMAALRILPPVSGWLADSHVDRPRKTGTILVVARCGVLVTCVVRVAFRETSEREHRLGKCRSLRIQHGRFVSCSSVVVQSPAKLNLFLEVIAKRPDGFHEIETLMCGDFALRHPFHYLRVCRTEIQLYVAMG